jgi:hypothetical protein
VTDPTRAQDPINNLSTFVRRLEFSKPEAKFTYLYRGHDSTGHILRPSLFRKQSNRQHEKNLLREVLSMHPSEFRQDSGVFEHLVRLQHFSLPTRLLDVTFNPLVALYFASQGTKNKDGEVLQFKFPSRNLKYFDSDTVSAVSNLSNLSGNERNQIRAMNKDDELVSELAGRRLLHFIKSEKPYFEPRIRLDHLKGFIPVKPRLSNRRILAQQGAFFLFGLTTKLDDSNSHGIRVSRTEVPGDNKAHIRAALDRIGINEATLFPEIDRAARYVFSQVSPET